MILKELLEMRNNYRKNSVRLEDIKFRIFFKCSNTSKNRKKVGQIETFNRIESHAMQVCILNRES